MSDSTAAAPPENAAGERIKEAERERIARDLHDELGSRLTAIKMALAQLSQQLPAQDATLQEQAHFTDQLVDDAIGAMHDLIDDLHPAVLDLGLLAALEWLAKNAARQTGISHRVLSQDDLPDALLDRFQLVSLYRIAREALHNAGRHAAARQVNISLQQIDAQVLMEITDDGVGSVAGIELAAAEPGASGIRGMRRRAAAIGAVLTLRAAEHGGVQLRVALPVARAVQPIE